MAERCEWLKRHGIDPVAPNWRDRLSSLDQTEQQNYGRLLFARWETCLDACHGECVLRKPQLAHIVGNSLRYFDGDRYLLTDFVVMPNHVHVLAAFSSPEGMLAQCDSWKHFTAWQINRALGRRGRFWEVDGFDHLVRGPEAFDRIRNYIADNPKRANLKAGEFLHYSRASLTRKEPHLRSECST
jgi:type I restriction enzyme R subunit